MFVSMGNSHLVFNLNLFYLFLLDFPPLNTKKIVLQFIHFGFHFLHPRWMKVLESRQEQEVENNFLINSQNVAQFVSRSSSHQCWRTRSLPRALQKPLSRFPCKLMQSRTNSQNHILRSSSTTDRNTRACF